MCDYENREIAKRNFILYSHSEHSYGAVYRNFYESHYSESVPNDSLSTGFSVVVEWKQNGKTWHSYFLYCLVVFCIVVSLLFP